MSQWRLWGLSIGKRARKAYLSFQCHASRLTNDYWAGDTQPIRQLARYLEIRVGAKWFPAIKQVQKRVGEISETGCRRTHPIAGANLHLLVLSSRQRPSKWPVQGACAPWGFCFRAPWPADQIVAPASHTGRSSGRTDYYQLLSALTKIALP